MHQKLLNFTGKISNQIKISYVQFQTVQHGHWPSIILYILF